MTLTDQEVNDKYHEKVINHAQWIDKEFLKEVLENDEDVEIDSFKVEPAVGAGDNYLSILYRVHVVFKRNGKSKEEHLMIKGFPTSQVLLDMIEDMGVFRREIFMYKHVLPAMSRLHTKYFPDDTDFVAAKSFPCNRENTLVMEDLGVHGYKMANRMKQLDFCHCIATLKALAKFHALSMKLNEEDPDMLQQIDGDLFNEGNREKMGTFLEGCVPMLAKETTTWGEGYEHLEEILLDISEVLWDKMMRMVKPTDTLNVLNHGDMWVNNILYATNTKDGKSETKAKLVDFQLARYTSPAADLLYFLFTSPQYSVLTQRWHDLIECYHSHFISYLNTLGVTVDYPQSQLESDMRERATFAIATMAQILPIITTPTKDVMDLDSFTEEDLQKPVEESPMANMYQGERYKEVARMFLLHLEHIGYLDAAREHFKPEMEEIRAYRATVIKKKDDSQ